MSLGIFGTRPKMAKPIASYSGLGGDWTWKNTAADAEVQAFQKALNVYLRKYGYYEIAEDGKLGPATCGAWLHLMNTIEGIGNEPGFPGDPASNWGSVCQGWTYPTKIGNATPESNPMTKSDGTSAALPWLTYSDATVAAQTQVNGHLIGHDMNPVGTDGKMGAGTCGAFRWLDKNTGSTFELNYGKNCQAFTDPTKKASTAPVATPVVVSPVTPVSPTDSGAPITSTLPTTKPKISTAGMVTGIAVVSGVAVLGWMYAKSKGYVANPGRRRRRRR